MMKPKIQRLTYAALILLQFTYGSRSYGFATAEFKTLVCQIEMSMRDPRKTAVVQFDISHQVGDKDSAKIAKLFMDHFERKTPDSDYFSVIYDSGRKILVRLNSDQDVLDLLDFSKKLGKSIEQVELHEVPRLQADKTFKKIQDEPAVVVDETTAKAEAEAKVEAEAAKIREKQALANQMTDQIVKMLSDVRSNTENFELAIQFFKPQVPEHTAAGLDSIAAKMNKVRESNTNAIVRNDPGKSLNALTAEGDSKIEKIFKSIQEPIDDLDLAIADAQTLGNAALLDALKNAQKMLFKTLTDNGFNEIEVLVGSAVDYDTQLSLSAVYSSDVPADHIVKVIRKGYRYKRTLYPASVIISKGPAL